MADTPGYFITGAVLGSSKKTSSHGKINASLTHMRYNFEDSGGDFHDFVLNAGYTHRLNEKLHVELAYRYWNREANSNIFQEFEENRLDLILHFGTGVNPLKAREWFYWVGLDNAPH